MNKVDIHLGSLHILNAIYHALIRACCDITTHFGALIIVTYEKIMNKLNYQIDLIQVVSS